MSVAAPSRVDAGEERVGLVAVGFVAEVGAGEEVVQEPAREDRHEKVGSRTGPRRRPA